MSKKYYLTSLRNPSGDYSEYIARTPSGGYVSIDGNEIKSRNISYLRDKMDRLGYVEIKQPNVLSKALKPVNRHLNPLEKAYNSNIYDYSPILPMRVMGVDGVPLSDMNINPHKKDGALTTLNKALVSDLMPNLPRGKTKVAALMYKAELADELKRLKNKEGLGYDAIKAMSKNYNAKYKNKLMPTSEVSNIDTVIPLSTEPPKSNKPRKKRKVLGKIKSRRYPGDGVMRLPKKKK